MSQGLIADPELLRRIQALELKAREVADGVLMGIHHAPHRGRSLEFAEHKEYTPGDDIRRIDWKVFAKSDRYYIKEFEDDTNINAVILMDGSRSMDFASDATVAENGIQVPTKLEQARVMTAALSYLLLTQSDAVGTGIIGEGLKNFLPPRARQAHFHEITSRLAGHQPEKGTDIESALADLAAMLKGRALIVIISDLLDEPDKMLKALRLLKHRRHEIAVFHVLDPYEVDFPYDRLSFFQDMEGPLRLLVDPRTIKNEYVKHMAGFIEQVRNECNGHGIDYWLARTDIPPVRLLSAWLSFRASTSGGRARMR